MPTHKAPQARSGDITEPPVWRTESTHPVQQTLSTHRLHTLQKPPPPPLLHLQSRDQHYPCQTCRQRHHDAQQRHHPAHVNQHMSAVETPRRHAAETRRLRPGRKNTTPPQNPPASICSKNNAPRRENDTSSPSSDPGLPDLGVPPQQPESVDDDCSDNDFAKVIAQILHHHSP